MIRAVTERRRRSHKGPRELVGTRVHPVVKHEIDQHADAAGVNRNDWLAAAIELALENPAELRAVLHRIRTRQPQLAFDDQEVLGESA